MSDQAFSPDARRGADATFVFTQESAFLSDINFSKARTDLKLAVMTTASWPCTVKDPFALDVVPDIVDELDDGVWRALWAVSNEMVATAWMGYGSVTVRVAATSSDLARLFMLEMRNLLPKHEPADKGLIPVTFWTYTKEGPRGTRRDLAAPSWEEIGTDNYARETATRLEALMDPGFRPGRSGQLILWHGKPGTGKTTALRALGQAWKEWAEIHYITDPDQFFGMHADYMLEVMLGAGDLEADKETPSPGSELKEPSKWRLLVLEDSGELLAKNAKSEIGAALSRFLNAVDGLIGQGLKVMTMVTTNEELGALNDAVTRHGRAASEIHFAPLSIPEAAKLLERLAGPDAVEGTPILNQTILADVYAVAEERDAKRPSSERTKVGFA